MEMNSPEYMEVSKYFTSKYIEIEYHDKNNNHEEKEKMSRELAIEVFEHTKKRYFDENVRSLQALWIAYISRDICLCKAIIDYIDANIVYNVAQKVQYKKTKELINSKL